MIGVETIRGEVSFVPVVDFLYPDEGDEPTPPVRDQWVEAPLVKKCQQRFAVMPSQDLMTMPLLDKRIEVLSHALREALERMDFNLIHQFAEKAIATRELRCARRRRTATPTTKTSLMTRSLALTPISSLSDLLAAGREDVPHYAFDCHTLKGKQKGKTKTDFFREDQRALKPFKPGSFDHLPDS